MKYANLTQEQIAQLENNGCHCDEWERVKVAEGFNTRYVHRVYFSGDVNVGSFDKRVTLAGDYQLHTGLYDARFHNAVIGDNCLVENVHGVIANYIVDSDVIIRNVTDITVNGVTSFGNGTVCNVLDETGSRYVRIHDQLSSHEAYMMACYKDRRDFVTALEKLVDEYVDSIKSPFGIIGHDTEIMDVKYIANVKIGPYTKIHGASRLNNGSINSNQFAPVLVGQNVIADDFILSSGSSVTDGVMLARCFVGQACMLGHSYSATDSLFFSNCQGELGEACATFAGPYTVTHHKSTLLIAGMYSFMNAGSGSNQSNHLYKLGPIHHGELQRGAKTTSDSYVLWPAKVGAFSLVMGRHVNNMDMTNLPFSYLIEQQGVSYVVPGVNLKSVGTIRDVQKWPQRDKRTDPAKLDKVNFNHLSPFTIQKVLNGINLLKTLRESSGGSADNYSFSKAIIRNSALNKGLRYYNDAVLKFLGNSIITKIQSASDISTDDALRKALLPDTGIGTGEWADISGLIAPQSEIDQVCADVCSGKIKNVFMLGDCFQKMSDNYYTYEWTWSYDKIQEYFGIDLASITRKQAAEIVKQWKAAVVGLDKLIYDDARKEFVLYPDRAEDFDSNPFVLAVKDHIQRKSELGDKILELLTGK